MVEKRHARRLVRAIDTNVVLRLLMDDDPAQHRIATALLAEPVLLTLTVLVETGWVLLSRYRFSRAEVATLLNDLLDYDSIIVEKRAGIRWALDRFAARGDFADLLHLVAADRAVTFATFDRGVAIAAGSDSPVAVETL